MTNPQKFWTRLILIIPPGAVIALHAYLGSFTRLIADDFCTAYFINRLGILRSAWYWYLNYTGFFSRSVINKILIWIDPYHMWVIVPAALIVWGGVSAWVIYFLTEKETESKDRLWVSISLSFAFIYLVLLINPQPTQSLYWWSGFSAYTVPLILVTFYFALYLITKRTEANGIGIAVLSITSFLMAFGIAGASESFSPTLLSSMIFLLGWELLVTQYNMRKPTLWFLVMGFLGSCMALIVMISAPGNAIRQSFFRPPPSVIQIIQIAAKGYFDFLKATILEPQKLTGIFGVYIGSIVLGINALTIRVTNKWVAVFFLLLGIFFASLCFPPAAYGMSQAPPQRVLVISSFILAAGLVASGYSCGNWLSVWLSKDSKKSMTLAMIIAMSFLICFSVWITSRNLYESRGIFLEFAGKWDQADAQILRAKSDGDESVTIPAMDVWTGPGGVPIHKKNNWINQCYSMYYGIQVLGPDPELQHP